MSAKLVPTSVDRGCRVVSARIPTAVNLDFLEPEPLLFRSSSQIYYTELKSERSADDTTGFVSPSPTSAEGKQQAGFEMWTLSCRKLFDLIM
jgi:hypothetical protein